MDIPKAYIIHDTRIAKDFKGITICGYKRVDVIKEFQNSMINNRLEDSIRWLVELHSTGLNNQIWESIKNIYIKYIHINNPKLFFYILKREKEYNNILINFPKKHEIFSRNNQEIRNLLAELIAILTLNKKNNIFVEKSLPIISNKSFHKDEVKKRMISKNLDNIHSYVFNSTTNEMKLALNEILTNLFNKNGTYQNCIYWYIWLNKIEKYIKTNSKIVIKENEYEEHWVFILWNIILNSIDNLYKKDIIFIKKLYDKYKNNFKISKMNQLKYYIFLSFYIIKNKVNWEIFMFPQEHLIIQSNSNINSMYENIILNIEGKLTNDGKKILYENYYKLLYKDEKNPIIRIKNTDLESNINNEENKSDNKLPINNIETVETEIPQKKMDIFSNLISYKKKKNVIEYYDNIHLNKDTVNNDNINNNFKNITFLKRK
jgi:hypothetical protein